MKDHTDRAGLRVLAAVAALLFFTLVVWVPFMILWVGPWLYEGVSVGSSAWRKANIFNLWLCIAPWIVTFAYCVATMSRAIRRDAEEREELGK